MTKQEEAIELLEMLDREIKACHKSAFKDDYYYQQWSEWLAQALSLLNQPIYGLQTAYQQVLDFHIKHRCYIGEVPSVPSQGTPALRETLIKEEYKELLSALTEGDLKEIADGIADCLYVLIGTAVSYGIDLPAVWDAVHTHNMQKTGGKRGDGKVLKTQEDGKPKIQIKQPTCETCKGSERVIEKEGHFGLGHKYKPCPDCCQPSAEFVKRIKSNIKAYSDTFESLNIRKAIIDAVNLDLEQACDLLTAQAKTIAELEQIIIEAKKCVKITQERNDQLQSTIAEQESEIERLQKDYNCVESLCNSIDEFGEPLKDNQWTDLGERTYEIVAEQAEEIKGLKEALEICLNVLTGCLAEEDDPKYKGFNVEDIVMAAKTADQALKKGED